jgi:hypothetical protein
MCGGGRGFGGIDIGAFNMFGGGGGGKGLGGSDDGESGILGGGNGFGGIPIGGGGGMLRS